MSGELEVLDNAARMLAQAQTPVDFANIVDAAEVARVLAKRARLGTEAVNRATAIKLDALCGLADAISEGQASGQIESPGGDRRSAPIILTGGKNDLAGVLGLSTSAAGVLVHRARLVKLVRPSDGDWDALRDGDELRTSDILKMGREQKGRIEREAERRRREEESAVRLWLRAEQAWIDLQKETPTSSPIRTSPDDPDESPGPWDDVLEWPEPPESITGTAVVHHCPATDLLDRLAGSGADLLLTDPPYASDVDDIDTFVAEWLPAAFACLDTEQGRAFVCTGAYFEEQAAYIAAMEEHMPTGWSAQMLIWHYADTLGPTPNQRYKTSHQVIWHLYGPQAPRLLGDRLTEMTTVHQFPMMRVDTPGGRLFSWQKPDALARRLIDQAVVSGALVIDPFAGTGTFLAAAADAGCQAVGSEMDPDRIDDCRLRGIDVA